MAHLYIVTCRHSAPSHSGKTYKRSGNKTIIDGQLEYQKVELLVAKKRGRREGGGGGGGQAAPRGTVVTKDGLWRLYGITDPFIITLGGVPVYSMKT